MCFKQYLVSLGLLLYYTVLCWVYQAHHGVTHLNIRTSDISDNGIAHIATALQTNTTMRSLQISRCSISDEGAESLAGALAVNRSLKDLDISDNEIGDNGIAHIATALQTNNTLTRLVFDEGGTVTDEGALSLAAALTANSSMEHLRLYWSSRQHTKEDWRVCQDKHVE